MKASFQFLILLASLSLAFYMERPYFSGQEGFDLDKALMHLDSIASEPHISGSPANARVGNYIFNQLENLNYEVLWHETTYTTNGRTGHHHGRAKNIIAKYQGTTDSVIALMAHYDSAINGPGAADDGHAVACMLEVARTITLDKPRHSIWFVFTDAEEFGLLGARGLAKEGLLDSVDVILNFEARGNSGPSRAFEWSDNNASLVKSFGAAVPRPVSSSLSYEIYKKMPNGTDFTAFKSDIQGINFAFIDGFSYYHSPEDTPANLNKSSMGQTGENMLTLVRQLSNENDFTADHNATFFNAIGIFISYHPMWDSVMLGLSFLLFLKFCWHCSRKKILKLKHVLLSLSTLLLSLLIVSLLLVGMQFILELAYPEYFHFYAGQFYNHKFYLVASLGIALACFVFLGRLMLKEVLLESYIVSVIGLFILLGFTTLLYMPGAAYMFIIPSLLLQLCVLTLRFLKKESFNPILYLPMVVLIGLWVTLIYNLHLAFCLKLMVGPGIVMVLMIAFLSCGFEALFGNRLFGYVCALMLFVFGIVGGHFTSQPSPLKPGLSDLNYLKMVDSDAAFWMTEQGTPSQDTRELLKDGATDIIDGVFSKNIVVFTNVKIDHELNLEWSYSSDSLEVQCIVKKKNAVLSYLELKEESPVNEIILQGKSIHSGTLSKPLLLIGYPEDEITFQFKLFKPSKIEGWYYALSEGLPPGPVIDPRYVRTGNWTILQKAL